MKRKYKLAAVAGLAVVLAVVLLAGQVLAQTGTPTPGGMMSGGGMMGGNSTGNAGMMSAGTVTPTVPAKTQPVHLSGATGVQSYGMMGGQQGMPYGMMGTDTYHDGWRPQNGMMGMMSNGSQAGMMGMSGGWSDPNAKPLTLDQAQAAAQKYIQALPNNAGANLVPMEVMEFSNGFYVAVGDKTTNTGPLKSLSTATTGAFRPSPDRT